MKDIIFCNRCNKHVNHWSIYTYIHVLSWMICTYTCNFNMYYLQTATGYQQPHCSANKITNAFLTRILAIADVHVAIYWPDHAIDNEIFRNFVVLRVLISNTQNEYQRAISVVRNALVATGGFWHIKEHIIFLLITLPTTYSIYPAFQFVSTESRLGDISISNHTL